MSLTERIKQPRKDRQMPQRHFAVALELNTATYSKTEKTERRVKAKQLVALAKMLSIDETELITFWLADKILDVIENETELAEQALNVAIENKSK